MSPKRRQWLYVRPPDSQSPDSPRIISFPPPPPTPHSPASLSRGDYSSHSAGQLAAWRAALFQGRQWTAREMLQRKQGARRGADGNDEHSGCTVTESVWPPSDFHPQVPFPARRGFAPRTGPRRQQPVVKDGFKEVSCCCFYAQSTMTVTNSRDRDTQREMQLKIQHIVGHVFLVLTANRVREFWRCCSLCGITDTE